MELKNFVSRTLSDVREGAAAGITENVETEGGVRRLRDPRPRGGPANVLGELCRKRAPHLRHQAHANAQLESGLIPSSCSAEGGESQVAL